jgi:hypothetical protein
MSSAACTNFLIIGVALAIACGGDSSGKTQAPEIFDYYCGAGNGSAPPSKLILPAAGGIPGRYLVVLMASVEDLHATAQELARRHGGVVFAEWESINGFGVSLADDAAPGLAGEPQVCWVEQDQWVTVASAP